MFSAEAMTAANMSDSSGHSSSTVISTGRTSPGRPVLTDTISESSHLVLILVCVVVSITDVIKDW